MATTIQDKHKPLSKSRNKPRHTQAVSTPGKDDCQTMSALSTEKSSNAAITRCVKQELRRYFDLLDGEEPSNVYQLVMRQAEHALIESVMEECGGNQSKATKWLGISRGNLRKKLSEMGCD